MSANGIVVTESTKDAHNELFVDGKSVSGLWVVRRTMRIGSATVRMGGIASVGTEEGRRNQGYARRLMEHSSVWMAEQGFDCAILFGIPDFYHRFGYEPCLIDCEMVVPTRRAERAEPRLAVRPFAAADRPALVGIYDAENGCRTGSVARAADGDWFVQGTRWNTPTESVVFSDEGGAPLAYAARDASDDAVTVCDLGAATSAAYSDILRWAADRAVELRCGEVQFHLPLGHPFADYASHFGARVTAIYPRASNGMGRILNLVPFLRAIAPELQIRARAAEAHSGTVRLDTDIGSAVLTWDGTEILVGAEGRAAATVCLPQYRLMQMAMGYHAAAILLAMPDVSTAGITPLLDALFPHRPGYMWLPDHF